MGEKIVHEEGKETGYMESVKGLQGYWHATDGSWTSGGNKLKTLCGRGISPNFRDTEDTTLVNCPSCQVGIDAVNKHVAWFE